MKKLIGKTIKSIEQPKKLEIDGITRNHDNYIITFTDGTKLHIASWDYEGYASGIDIEVLPPPLTNNQ